MTDFMQLQDLPFIKATTVSNCTISRSVQWTENVVHQDVIRSELLSYQTSQSDIYRSESRSIRALITCLPTSIILTFGSIRVSAAVPCSISRPAQSSCSSYVISLLFLACLVGNDVQEVSACSSQLNDNPPLEKFATIHEQSLSNPSASFVDCARRNSLLVCERVQQGFRRSRYVELTFATYSYANNFGRVPAISK